MNEHDPITAADLDEVERLDREATPEPWVHIGGRHVRCKEGGDSIPARTTDDARFIARARTLLPRFAAAYRAQGESLRLTADALQREIERTTRLEDDLARARAVNEQAEKVRDENDRMRALVGRLVQHATRDDRTPEFVVVDTRDFNALAATVRP